MNVLNTGAITILVVQSSLNGLAQYQIERTVKTLAFIIGYKGCVQDLSM